MGNDQNCANLTIESFMKVTFSYTNLTELRLSKIFSMGLPKLPLRSVLYNPQNSLSSISCDTSFFIKLARSTEHGWMTDALVSQYHNDHSLNCWNPGIIDVFRKGFSCNENLIQKTTKRFREYSSLNPTAQYSLCFLRFRWYCFKNNNHANLEQGMRERLYQPVGRVQFAVLENLYFFISFE